ncbi:MAG TPA: tetratricopeptide repeat protein [Pirellulales bacterium]|jgi:tetratricopeptide (TPR) repeat protein|nr:tetratricopeptide repeat protein [Pirellulales bacterium]
MGASMRCGVSAAALMIGLASSVGGEEPKHSFGRWAAGKLQPALTSAASEAGGALRKLKKSVRRFGDAGLDSYLTWLDVVEIQAAQTSAADEALGRAAPLWRLGRAMKRSRAGQYEAAFKDVNACLKLNPQQPDAWSIRGRIWLEKKQFFRAIHDLSRAIDLDPRTGDAYQLRAYGREQIGDLRRALEDAGKAIEFGPQAFSFSCRATIRRRLGDHAGALADLNKAIELAPNDAYYHELRGDAHHRLGDFDAAIADCNRALELDPNMAVAYVVRGLAWSSKRDFAKADADLSEASRLDPEAFPPGPGLQVSPVLAEDKPNSGHPAKSNADAADRSRADDFSKVYSKRFADGRFAADHETPDEQPMPIEPDFERRNKISSLSKLAWRAAASPDERYRDGARAVEAASEACKLGDWKQPWPLEALAAAYAECGDFAAAVRYQKQAIQIWDEQQRSPFRQRPDKSDSPELNLLTQERQEREDRLELYRNHQTYRGER